MADNIAFSGGGKMGDFIHQLFVVKNICEEEETKADLYIRDNGQTWTYGLQRAYDDLKELVEAQDYINSFQIGKAPHPSINLDSWRDSVMPQRYTKGVYTDCWTYLLCKVYGMDKPKEYAWLQAEPNPFFEGKTIIHESLTRKNSRFDYTPYLKDAVFVTSNPEEADKFKHEITVHLVGNLSKMASAIAGCDLFIGNQSMPLALATALDVRRIGVLDHDAAPFYVGEENYSNYFSWFL